FIFTFLLVTEVFLFDTAKDAKCDAYSNLISWLAQYFIILTGVFYSSYFPYDGLIKI
ncbi:aquaporin, partial [Salmonella enterica]|nr:aquaporin [Salmonella enterica]